MKKAIIIGATSGIGQEVAKCLLLEGWKIGVAGRRQSSLENLQRHVNTVCLWKWWTCIRSIGRMWRRMPLIKFGRD